MGDNPYDQVPFWVAKKGPEARSEWRKKYSSDRLKERQRAQAIKDGEWAYKHLTEQEKRWLNLRFADRSAEEMYIEADRLLNHGKADGKVMAPNFVRSQKTKV